jgi:hypothetical protein
MCAIIFPKEGANKCQKSQIRLFARFNFCLDLRTFRKCGNLRFFTLRTQLFLAGLTLPQISKYIIFLPTNICHSIIRSTYTVFRCLKYTCLAKKNSIRGKRSGSETLLFSLQIWGFAICRLSHRGNLRICDLRINHYKCWGPAHSLNLRICDCGISPKFAGL